MLLLKDEYQNLRLIISQVERELFHGSILIRIELKNRFFIANIEGIWLDFEDIKAFIVELDILEKSRNGKAELSAMSLSGFYIKIFNTDTSGHLAAEICIEKEPKPFTTKISTTFKIDPSSIPNIIFFMTELLNR